MKMLNSIFNLKAAVSKCYAANCKGIIKIVKKLFDKNNWYLRNQFLVLIMKVKEDSQLIRHVVNNMTDKILSWLQKGVKRFLILP